MNEVNNLVVCIKISLTNRDILLTNNDEEVCYLNEVYSPTYCLKVEKIRQINELGEDEFNISFIISAENLEYKLLDELNLMRAMIEITIIDRDNLEGLPFVKKKGFVSKLNKNNDFISIEAKTLGGDFNIKIGCLYSSTCRALFGGEKCGIDIKKYSYHGVVSRVVSNECIVDSQFSAQEQSYVGGVIKFISALDSPAHRVNDNKGDNISFINDTRFKVSVGDQYIIYMPCDKSFRECKERFSNVLNFRGEPFIPNKYKLVASNY